MERIQLENAVFEGQNNAYLFDGGRTTLVDTGVFEHSQDLSTSRVLSKTLYESKR